MRPSSMIFVVLLFSISLVPQTSASGPAVLVQPPSAHACPVLLSVDRIPDGAIIRANLTGQPLLHRQGLTVTFKLAATQIVAADITVHFYPDSAHAIPAAPAGKGAAESTRTFRLGGTGKPIEHSSIWTDYPAPISWVELTRLEYANGTTWQSSAPRQCGAAPNLFVLVDQAK